MPELQSVSGCEVTVGVNSWREENNKGPVSRRTQSFLQG